MNTPTMPWRAQAELMVQRGEAKNFSAACSKMAKRRPRPQQPQQPRRVWSPYKED